MWFYSEEATDDSPAEEEETGDFRGRNRGGFRGDLRGNRGLNLYLN